MKKGVQLWAEYDDESICAVGDDGTVYIRLPVDTSGPSPEAPFQLLEGIPALMFGPDVQVGIRVSASDVTSLEASC